MDMHTDKNFQRKNVKTRVMAPQTGRKITSLPEMMGKSTKVNAEKPVQPSRWLDVDFLNEHKNSKTGVQSLEQNSGIQTQNLRNANQIGRNCEKEPKEPESKL